MQSATPQPGAAARPQDIVTPWRVIRVGLAPLALLIVAVALTVALTALARALTAPLGFLVWRWLVAGVWIAGLLISFGLYAVSAYRTLRQAIVWQGSGLRGSAAAIFWLLAIVAVLVLLPTLIAATWPQSPTPPQSP